MKIALSADGRSPHTERWANAFAARGHNVTLVWRPSLVTASALSRYDAKVRHFAATSMTSRHHGDELVEGLDTTRPVKAARRVRPCQLARSRRPQRPGDRVDVIWGDGDAGVCLADDPCRLIPLGQRENRPSRGEVLERLACRFRRVSRRKQDERVRRPVQSQRLSSRDGAEMLYEVRYSKVLD